MSRGTPVRRPGVGGFLGSWALLGVFVRFFRCCFRFLSDFFTHLPSKSRFEPIFFKFGSIFGGFWKVLGGFREGFFDVFLLLCRKTPFCEN